MKKYLSIIFAVLVVANVLIGCTGMVPNINVPGSTSELEGIPDSSFSKEDYQKLLALQFDDYMDMTVAEYQSRVWKLTDTTEYRNLLERFSRLR